MSDQYDGRGPVWVVRAGKGGKYADEFVTHGLVAIGWRPAGPIEADTPGSEIDARVAAAFPEAREGSRKAWAGSIRRFLRDVRLGERVVTYDPSQRLYFLGTIASEAGWREEPLCRFRKVTWSRKVARARLSVGTRNSLGAISTLFRLPAEVGDELWRLSTALDEPTNEEVAPDTGPAEGDVSEEDLREDVAERAQRFIEDRLARLSWDQMQELVAGLLRAMGYRTRVSEPGPDRGVDVFASPDGLGLQEPRIFAEVKHRGGAMGASEIRSFLGGRQRGDRCLYISTGGFSREARYEAERASVPLRLIALPDLRELLVEHYEQLDPETRALVPLQRVYWPVD